MIAASLALRLRKTNARSATILCDEFDARLSKGRHDCDHIAPSCTRMRAVCFRSLDGRNG